ncbi:hypothetical protein BGW39_001479 [Mortierella sp. 14UC]|nr:hypothetical protein BGW39_001479 [Mortierella sp. 14UC]
MENRHKELSIVTNGPGSGEWKNAEVVEVEEGPILSPLSAGLDRRYWQLAESAEGIERLQDEVDQATTLFKNDDEDTSSDASSDDEQSHEEERDEVDNSATSSTGPQRRRVRFMKEIQIIPSSRTSSDDDGDLTLIDDSDEEDESADDSDNAGSNMKESVGNVTTTIATTKAGSKQLTLSSEWKALKVVESILAMEE